MNVSSPRFTLTQLRYFLAVAEAGSITEAANHLSIAQSAISVAIQNLENDLSTQLFIRDHAKGVRLTTAGERFLRASKELLDHAQELDEFGRGLGESMAGDLTIGCFAFIAPFFLPALLRRFKARYPLIRVTTVENNIHEVQRQLLSGICDIGLFYDVNISDRLDKETLASYPPYAVLPEGHELAGKRTLSLKELAPYPMVLIDLPHSRDYVATLAKLCGVELNIGFRTGNYEMVRSLVGHGHGYSVLNQRVAVDRTYDGMPVVSRELEGDLPPVRLVLAQVAGLRQSQRAKAFVDACREFFADRGGPTG